MLTADLTEEDAFPGDASETLALIGGGAAPGARAGGGGGRRAVEEEEEEEYSERKGGSSSSSSSSSFAAAPRARAMVAQTTGREARNERVGWSEAEKQWLVDGVRKHGVGSWAVIR
jgi:hypothetical protein